MARKKTIEERYRITLTISEWQRILIKITPPETFIDFSIIKKISEGTENNTPLDSFTNVREIKPINPVVAVSMTVTLEQFKENPDSVDKGLVAELAVYVMEQGISIDNPELMDRLNAAYMDKLGF